MWCAVQVGFLLCCCNVTDFPNVNAPSPCLQAHHVRIIMMMMTTMMMMMTMMMMRSLFQMSLPSCFIAHQVMMEKQFQDNWRYIMHPMVVINNMLTWKLTCALELQKRDMFTCLTLSGLCEFLLAQCKFCKCGLFWESSSPKSPPSSHYNISSNLHIKTFPNKDFQLK